MVSKALTVRFDYTTVGKEEKGKLIYLAGEIKKANSSHLKFGIAVGEAVAKAHALLACDGKDGQFSAWVEAECGFGRTTAYKYMQVWDAFNDCEVIDQFDLSALQTLSAPKAPEKARIEAVKLAKKGEHITNDRSKELCDQFREKPAPNPKNSGVVVHNVNNSNDHDASVTGTAEHIPASPPVLPSVGTANRTESGSQGSGDAGECPRGGKCDRDEGGTCVKCKDPPPVVEIEGGASFDPANIEAHAESFAANFAAKVKAHNLEIERFARSIMEAFANPPKSVWLDESRLGIALDQIKSACATIRQAKAHDKPCPKCDGKGTITGKPCKRCLGVGYMPERTYEMAGGQ